MLDRFDPEAVTRFGMVLRRLGPDLASLLEVPRELRYCDPAALVRAVVAVRPEDDLANGLAEVFGRSAASAVPAAPAERNAILRELLARPGEVLVPGVAREVGERDAERLLAR